MRNFVKRHLTGIIALVLLSVIAVLSLLTVKSQTVYSSALSADDLEPLSDETPIEKSKSTEVPTPDYVKTLPKTASPSDEYLFTQKLCGVGNVAFCEAIVTPVGLYVIAETDCEKGDIEGQKRTVGALKLDSTGNLEKSMSFSFGVPVGYVTTQMTACGIVVVCADESKTYLYVTVLSYDLTEQKTTLLSYAERAEIFATEEGFLLFCSGEKEGVLYEYSDDGVRFFTLPCAEPVRILEYADRYAVFYNTAMGYGECDVRKKTFSVPEDRRYAVGKLLDVLPLTTPDGQITVALVEDGGLTAIAYGKDHERIASRKIGSYRALGVGTDGQYIYLAAQGSVSGVIRLDADLTTSFSAFDLGFLPTVLHDSYYDESSFYLLLSDEEKTALVKIGDGTNVVFLPSTDHARLCPNKNGTFCIVQNGRYYSYTAVDVYGLTI